MREIRFRGKTLDGLRWVYGDLIQENSGRVVIRTNLNTWAMNNDVNPYGESLDVIPETVGQYTGLKDRNGKDVYEGDIVQWYQLDMEHEGFYSGGGFMDITTSRIARKMHAVYFAEGGFRLDPIVNGDLPYYVIPSLSELCAPTGCFPGELFFENYPDYPDNRDEFPHVEKSDLYRAEIIGNIFDNPGMLEGEDNE